MYLCVCTYLYISIYMCVHTYLYICTYIILYTCIHIYIHLFIDVCVCVCVCMYVRTYINVKFVRRTHYVWSWPSTNSSTNLTHTSMYSSSGELITFGDDEGGLYLWADKAALEAKSMTQSPISGTCDEIHCNPL